MYLCVDECCMLVCLLFQTWKPKQICLHANYNSNLPVQASQQSPPRCHTLSLTTTLTQPCILTDCCEDSSTPIKDNKQDEPLGKTIPHLTCKAFNSLLHNYYFDVDGMHRMKGEQTVYVPSLRLEHFQLRHCKNTHVWITMQFYWCEKCIQQ